VRLFEAISYVLSKLDVEHVFGLTGGADTALVREFTQNQGQFVSAVDRTAPVAMADGYARVSGRVGVATIDRSSDLVGALAPIVEAVRNRTPLVLLNSTRSSGPQTALLVAGTGAGHDRVYSSASAGQDLSRCFQRAVTESRPLVVDIPSDVLDNEVDERPRVSKPLPSGRPDITVDSLDTALGLIATAQRPVVLAGWGAVSAGAGEELIGLAGRMGGVLATTLRAKDYFRGHPHNIGIFGRLSSQATASTIAEADCVVAFGASLNMFTTLNGALVEDKRVVQVDHDPTRLGATTMATETVTADALLAARAMNIALDEAGHTGSTRWAQQAASAQQEHESATSQIPEEGAAIEVASAMWALDVVLPTERALVNDMGHFVVDVWPTVGVPHPTRLVNMNASGLPGLGLSGAVGVATACPDLVVLTVLDSNALTAAPAALATAVVEDASLIAAVCNRGDTEVAQLAESLGVGGATIRTIGDITELESRFGDRKGPMVLDLRLPPET